MAEGPVAPGWYRHSEMVNTLCYWDGNAWTDHVQPLGADPADSVARGITKVLIVLGAIALVVAMAYYYLAADDDVDCSVRNMDHAANNEPPEDCD